MDDELFVPVFFGMAHRALHVGVGVFVGLEG